MVVYGKLISSMKQTSQTLLENGTQSLLTVKVEIDKEKRIADCYFYKIPPFVHESFVCASVTGRDFDVYPRHNKLFELATVEF